MDWPLKSWVTIKFSGRKLIVDKLNSIFANYVSCYKSDATKVHSFCKQFCTRILLGKVWWGGSFFHKLKIVQTLFTKWMAFTYLNNIFHPFSSFRWIFHRGIKSWNSMSVYHEKLKYEKHALHMVISVGH